MKKKYEAPLITNPESGNRDFIPLGATACSYGEVGSACANGTEPSGGPSKCSVGGNPTTSDCKNGNSAGDSCFNGTDAITSCDIGHGVQGDCTRGDTPMGDMCSKGTSAGTCSSGTSGGA